MTTPPSAATSPTREQCIEWLERVDGMQKLFHCLPRVEFHDLLQQAPANLWSELLALLRTPTPSVEAAKVCETCGGIGRVMANIFDADRFDVRVHGTHNDTMPCPNCASPPPAQSEQERVSERFSKADVDALIAIAVAGVTRHYENERDINSALRGTLSSYINECRQWLRHDSKCRFVNSAIGGTGEPCSCGLDAWLFQTYPIAPPASAARLALSGWVPVMERLPERNGYYEVSSSEPWPPSVYVLEFRDASYKEHAHWVANGDFRGYVTAWRELPEPYLDARGKEGK